MKETNLFISTCLILCTLCFSSGCLSAGNKVSATKSDLELNSEPLIASKIIKSFENYDVLLYFNPSIFPGDPFFIKTSFIPKTKDGKKLFSKEPEVSACYWSNANPEKALRKTTLYAVPGIKTKTFIGAMPSSTYLESAEYRTTVSWKFENGKTETAEYYVKVSPKEFVSETIYLDARNTAIRTDDSELRKTQIEKLNIILSARNPDSIYETEGFIYPTTATRRTSFFADRRIFAYSNGKSATSLHYGIDWGVPEGSLVSACGKGKVVMAENRITTGWSVCIEHLPGLYSLYYHMNKLDVTEGQIVQKGQRLGESGCTGLATGPHIHWEVRLNTEAVNPEYFTINGMQ